MVELNTMHVEVINNLLVVLQNNILGLHNSIRNYIAMGKTGHCESIAMNAVQLNHEPEYLASLNALQCQMKHDQCRNTRKFPMAGQNLAWEFKEQSTDHLDDRDNRV